MPMLMEMSYLSLKLIHSLHVSVVVVAAAAHPAAAAAVVALAAVLAVS